MNVFKIGITLWILIPGIVRGVDTLSLSFEDIPQWATRSLWTQIMQAQTQAQRGLAQQAQSALWPQVFFSGNYQYSSYVQKFTQRVIVGFDPATGRPIFQEIPIEFGKHHTHTLSVGLQYPLWDWGRFRYLAKAQKEQVSASEIRQDQTVQNLIYSAQQIYYSLLALQESQNLLDEMEQTLKQHYESTRERYNQGLASELDLLQAEVNWRTLAPQKEQVHAQFESLLNTLRNLLDLPDQPIRLLDSLNTDVPSLPDTLALFQRLEDRPDIVALDHQIRATEQLLAAAKTEDKPTVTLQTAYTLRNPIGFEQKWGTMGTVSVGLTLPIFDGFRTKGKVLQMAATLRSLRLLRQKTLQEAKRTIRSLLQELASLRSQIEARKDNLRLAEKMQKAAEQQFDLGLLSQLEYLNAANAYLQAKVQYFQAIAEYHVKLLELKKTVDVGTISTSSGNSGTSSSLGATGGGMRSPSPSSVSPQNSGGMSPR